MTKTFRNYFCYKFSNCKRLIIFFAILNFLNVLLPSIMMNITYSYMLDSVLEVEKEGGGIIVGMDLLGLSQFIMVVVAPIIIVMIMAATVNSFAFYNKRTMTDTLGCLPISYGERFRGDLLSVIFANFISFVPLLGVSLILIGNLKNPKYDVLETYYYFGDIIQRLFGGFWITLLLVYLGVYAVTAFAASCCGRKNSAVLYSVIAMAVLPGIYVVYGNDMLSRVLGMDAFYELLKNVGMLPPLGPVVSIVMATVYNEGIPLETKECILYENPLYLAIYLILVAAFIAGAYFVGKRRRAENVGESFVFKSAYHVLTMTFMVLLIGASFVGYSNIMADSGIPFVLLFTFIVYAALEISQNKGFKGFWKTAVRYAAVFGICIGFFAVVKNTNAFNMYRSLPSAASVREVRLSGKYFFTHYRNYDKTEYVLDTKNAISDILSEHESLLDSNSVKTGEELKVVYVLKNGVEVMRNYSVINEERDAVKSFCDAAKALPDFDFGDLGIIDDPDLDKYSFNLSVSEENQRRYVREDKLEEFAEALIFDIKHNYSVTDHYNSGRYGHLSVTEKNKKHDYDNDYTIYSTYAATIEFFENPDNYTTDEVRSDVDTYLFAYADGEVSVRVDISTDDTNPLVKELLSYIVPRGEDFDPNYDVRITSEYTSITYTVDRANTEAAMNAMLELFLERH